MIKIIRTPEQLRPIMTWAFGAAKKGLESAPVVIDVRRETRKLVLNALMWVLLTDVAKQVELHGERYSKETWKVIFLTAFRREQKREQRWIIGIDGFPVEDEGGTSKMSNREISDFIEYIQAYGTERGVKWTAPRRYFEQTP